MDDLIPKLIAFAAVIAMLIFDWPRALAGAVLGFAALHTGRPWVVLPAGIVAIAGLGELLYAATGFRDAVTRDGFMLGLVTAAITSLSVRFGFDGDAFGGGGA